MEIETLELEIRPVVLVNDKGEVIPHNTKGEGNGFDQDFHDDPRAIWGVYKHLPEGGAEHIVDCASEKDAEIVADLLKKLYQATGKMYY